MTSGRAVGIASTSFKDRSRCIDELHRLPGLVRQAVEAGVVEAATALNGGVSLHDESRRGVLPPPPLTRSAVASPRVQFF